MTSADRRAAPAPPGFHLWVAELDPAADAAQALAWRLSPEERATASGLLIPLVRRRYLAAHLFLRDVLGGYLGLPPERVALAVAAGGKPFLEDGAEGLHFNLSHSAGHAVCALSRGRAVGVDLERIRKLRHPDELAQRVLSAGEMQEYRALPPAERELALLRSWTHKEACLKASGEGITRPLREVETAGWAVVEMRVAPDFLCAVATPPPAGQGRVFAWAGPRARRPMVAR